jgi:DNA topoisomerase-2
MNQTKYLKLDHVSHILSRPDTYVGSKIIEKISEYVFSIDQIIKKEIEISPAFVRVFQEILSNAVDNNERTSNKKMSYISVEITKSEISIKNDGAVIPIEKNKECLYYHSLIFGHLLTGSNYDDEEKRFTAGRNGLGAKLTNVLSTEFIVEAVDSEKKLKFFQKWTNNMKNTKDPSITKSSLKNGYTKITWTPDFKWFGMKELKKDQIEFLTYLVLNAGMVTGLEVSVNKTILPNKLTEYFNLMVSPPNEMLKLSDENSKVFVVSSETGFESISFVNGIRTKNGGKHVLAWTDAVCKPIIDKIAKKKSTSKLTVKDVKIFFRFLIVTRISNPEFESQEKNELKTVIKVNPITTSQVTKILSWSIGKNLKELILKKETNIAVKEIALKKTKHPKIDGYDKANYSGTNKRKDCTLIVCEGLSAKTFCVEGIDNGIKGLVGKGRDYFGIYPLRGKILNTRNATPSIISKNVVVTNLINILGLDYKKPKNFDKLNYGHLIILTDADTDGIHIEGLILNLFHSLFPEILKTNFILSMKTPLIKIGLDNYIYDERSWRQFIKKKSIKQLQIKYHKGLGTIKQNEVKKVFGKKMLQFNEDKNSDRFFAIAFDKEESDERKKWLSEYSPLENNQKYPTLDDEKDELIKFPISRHLNTELIKFFHDDCKRSLPNAIDGLKESQRKIVFTVKLRDDKKPVKVAQLAASVAEKTSYHHGEQNLANTIVNLAQSFIGSNNLQLFTEDGMFGSRLEGGKDAANSRYISTKKINYFDLLFPEEDDQLLIQKEEDGIKIEPFYYVPTIPILLINGSTGIGTGWSCSCPLFNPKDVLKASKLWMMNKRSDFESFVSSMIPWYRGFKGKIEKVGNDKFKTFGIFSTKNNITTIKELPIGLWTSSFIEWIEEKNIKYINRSTPENVDIEIHDELPNNFETKLNSSLSLENIVVFDEEDFIKKVTLIDIFDIWGKSKLELLKKRKETKLEKLNFEKNIMELKYNFILAVKSKKIDLTDELKNILEKLAKITKIDSEQKLLLDMNVRSLTLEKCSELLKRLSDLESEIKNLQKKTEKDLWNSDLTNFVNEWEKENLIDE